MLRIMQFRTFLNMFLPIFLLALPTAAPTSVGPMIRAENDVPEVALGCGSIDGSWVLAAATFDLSDVEVLNETTTILARHSVSNHAKFSFTTEISEPGPAKTEMNIKRPEAITPTLVNVARGKPAFQSSNNYVDHGHASEAVDGNTDRNFHSGSVTHTRWARNSFWYVDLQSVYHIHSVKIYNRGDCCGGRLNGARLFIDGKNTGIRINSGQIQTYNVNTKGKVVNIVQTNNILSLAEVEVYSTDIPVLTPVPFYDQWGYLDVKPTEKESLMFGPNTISSESIKKCTFEIPPQTQSQLSIQRTFRKIKLQMQQYWVKANAKKCYTDLATTITMTISLEVECLEENTDI